MWVFPSHLPFKHPWKSWFWCVYCYLSWQPKVPPGTWNHSLALQGSVSSLLPTTQLLRTQSSFPAFTANIFNPVIQSSKSWLESKSPHTDFICVCMWILSGLSDKLSARSQDHIVGALFKERCGGECCFFAFFKFFLNYFFKLFVSSLVFLGKEMCCELIHYPPLLQFSINKTATVHDTILSAAPNGTDYSWARWEILG